MFCKTLFPSVALFALGPLWGALQAQESNDGTYSEKIAEYTTDARFLNELVDHLPRSKDVPSPLDYFGTIVGAPDVLHYTQEIHDYFRALSEASPRVAMRTIGRSEENRDMVEVIRGVPFFL